MRAPLLAPAAVTAIALAALWAGGARADDALAGAQRAYGEVDYPKCKDDAQRALQGPADKPARVDAWRYLGLCEAALGDTDKARDAFKHMIAIDKDARLPDGLSPRFTSSFREAKGAFVTGAPLGFTVLETRESGGVRTIKLKLVDELDLVQKIGWRGAAGSSAAPVRAAPLQELELPAEVDVTVSAYDSAGGEVAILLLPAKKTDAPPPPPNGNTAHVDEAPFPWVAVIGVAAGVVVLAGAGTAAAVVLAPPQKVTLKTDVVFGK